MDETREQYVDLIKRIDEMFHEVDNEIMMDLLHNNEEYAAMRKQILAFQKAHPFIPDVMERKNGVALTAEEHALLIEYFDLYRRMEDIERQQIYFRGHTDCFAYLKRIGVI